MVAQHSITLDFKCPDDFQLREADTMARHISILYNKLENLAEGRYEIDNQNRRVPFSSEPEQTSILKSVRYGSDFVLVLLTAALVGEGLVLMIDAAQRIKERADANKRELTRKEFKRLLKEHEGDALKRAAASFAADMKLSPDELLEAVGDDLAGLYELRGRFIPSGSAYQ